MGVMVLSVSKRIRNVNLYWHMFLKLSQHFTGLTRFTKKARLELRVIKENTKAFFILQPSCRCFVMESALDGGWEIMEAKVPLKQRLYKKICPPLNSFWQWKILKSFPLDQIAPEALKFSQTGSGSSEILGVSFSEQ